MFIDDQHSAKNVRESEEGKKLKPMSENPFTYKAESALKRSTDEPEFTAAPGSTQPANLSVYPK